MRFNRLIRQIGEDAFRSIQSKTVLIVGLGGVGGNAAEAIARTGFGTILLVDQDVVDITNVNRQLIALDNTMGMAKVDVMKERIHGINPDAVVIPFHLFYEDTTKAQIWSHPIDYVIDAIDTVTYKIDLIKETQARGIPAIHVMGTGNKFAPEKLDIIPLSKTEYDPIARVIRNKLRGTHNLNRIMVVASTEPPLKLDPQPDTPTSNALVPSTAGILAASYVFRHAIGKIA